MKRALLLGVVAIVLAANGWIVLSTMQNRRAASAGLLELTERELHLPPTEGESTVTWLELTWDTARRWPDQPGAARWLDAAKLTELGFDCTVPPTAPAAREHYRLPLAARVFLVLEFEGEAWRQAPADRKPNTRLFVVDAGRQPGRLREKYPDTTRYAIAHGLVRLALEEPHGRDGTLVEPPYLQGWIQAVLPNQIFVPPPASRTLEGLRPPQEPAADDRQVEPRFVAKVAWGSRYEPWVSEISLLPAAGARP